MTKVELLEGPTMLEKTFDYFFDHTIAGKVTALFGAFLLCVWGIIEEIIHPNSFFEFMENRRNAEENALALRHYIGKEQIDNSAFKIKWDMINRAVTFHLHSGRYTTEEQHQLLKYKDVCKQVHNFFKRNNINLYSENFDPEYVAKCIREQEIC